MGISQAASPTRALRRSPRRSTHTGKSSVPFPKTTAQDNRVDNTSALDRKGTVLPGHLHLGKYSERKRISTADGRDARRWKRGFKKNIWKFRFEAFKDEHIQQSIPFSSSRICVHPVHLRLDFLDCRYPDGFADLTFHSLIRALEDKRAGEKLYLIRRLHRRRYLRLVRFLC